MEVTAKLMLGESKMDKILKTTKPLLWSAAFLMTALITACGGGGGGGGTPSTSNPTVTSTVPVDASNTAAINASLTATFSEAMDPATISGTTFTLQQGITPVAGTVSYTGKTAKFTPTPNLVPNTLYTATVTTGAKDLAGDALAATKTWSFTTRAAPGLDATAPTVTSTVPVAGSATAALNTRVTATFSEVMDPFTISGTTFTLQQGITPVAGSVSYTGTTATFIPTSNLSAGPVYTATVTVGAKDLASIPMAAPFTWTFTTIGTAAVGPAPVILGKAGDFVILSKSGITTTAGTAVTGDLGVSPIAASSITGFALVYGGGVSATSTLVTGNIYAADYLPPTPANLTTAIGDMMIAYTDAAGRTTPDFTELNAGNISGLTLVPGLYKWGTGVTINSDVTLNGGPNDVWIFQISGDLTQANATSVLLTGGALPKNVFWQVGGGTGVAIGTTAQMRGVILAAKAITVNTGASVNGRLLAQTAVTLDANAVTQPAP